MKFLGKKLLEKINIGSKGVSTYGIKSHDEWMTLLSYHVGQVAEANHLGFFLARIRRLYSVAAVCVLWAAYCEEENDNRTNATTNSSGEQKS